MRFWLGVSMLAAICGSAFGEVAGDDRAPQADVVRSKALTRGNIAEATEVLRDPTQMSGNFRQAVKNMAPAQAPSSSAGAARQNFPTIELVAKAMRTEKAGKVVLRVGNSLLHMRLDNSVSIMHNGALLTLRIDEITAEHVQVHLLEFNQTLILQ
ncbi:hypothetical protein [Methylotuvimicrobium alcaliphilum]|uniref:Uncharacterized protein n=1 Tax=Methylotuvimicrobium alcaliphilum (strain DSM 19304 / NCIMB 14124 / VKM B-2133 / 20Z) TaxID=1091494 RepID=G4SYH4_META2|nr:hypothetical protein [Methylotuvimicrobium alcaliphilum]CCE22175.1 exported protein of unknown function [Methylotuvimicrobium alcaliphilum 20Z]